MSFLSFQRTNLPGGNIFASLHLNIFALVRQPCLIQFFIFVKHPERQESILFGRPSTAIHPGDPGKELVIVGEGTVLRSPCDDKHEHVRPELSGREVHRVSEKGVSEEG